MSNPSIGNSGFGAYTIKTGPNRLPTYTQEFTGTQSDVNFSASVYYNKGWQVTVTNGFPWKMVATMDVELGSDNLTPLTGTGSYFSVNYSIHYNPTDVEIVNVSQKNIAWINQINDQDKQQLRFLIANPPSASSAINWTPGMLFSTSSTSISASQTVWYLYTNGTTKVPVCDPVFHFSIEVPSTFDFTYYNTNNVATNPTGCIYSRATMISQLGIPSNWANGLPSATDPATSTTYGIPYHYAFRKEAPAIQGNGARATADQDWTWGLWAQNIYGVPY